MATEFITSSIHSTGWGGCYTSNSPDMTSGQWGLTLQTWHDGREDRTTPTWAGVTMDIVVSTGGTGNAHTGGCKICKIPITPAIAGVQSVVYVTGYQDCTWFIQVNGAVTVDEASYANGGGNGSNSHTFATVELDQLILTGAQTNATDIYSGASSEETAYIGEKQHAGGSMACMYTHLTEDASHVHQYDWGGLEDNTIAWVRIGGAIPNNQIIVAE